MNKPILILALLGSLALIACDKPTVVNVPAAPVTVPGPAGPVGDPGVQGATGNQGDTGVQGDTGAQGEAGKPGDATTVIITPPAEPAAAK